MICWDPHEIGSRIPVVHWKRKWQSTPVFLPGKSHGQYEKVKMIGHQMITAPPPAQKGSNMLLQRSRGQLLIASERMKWLCQSRNDAQVWMCLVVKIKLDAIKNNIA